MSAGPKCAGCDQPMPTPESELTMIEAVNGWRVARVRNEQGIFVAVCYCPTCWGKRKERKRG